MSVLLRDPKVCIFYLKGTCAFGYRCTKTHGEPLIEGSKDANVNNVTHQQKASEMPDICTFYLKGKCAFGHDCVRSHLDNGGSKHFQSLAVQSPQDSPNPVICTHFLVGKCLYGDSCYKLHSTQAEIEKKFTINETKAEIDDLLFGRLDLNDKKDQQRITTVQVVSRNIPTEVSHKPKNIEKAFQKPEISSPTGLSTMKKGFCEKTVQKTTLSNEKSNVAQIINPEPKKEISKATVVTPDLTKISIPKTKANKQSKKSSAKKTSEKSTPANKSEKDEPLNKNVDKNEDEQIMENPVEEEIEEVVEEKKLTKKERKRQDRLLMSLAKKKLKQQNGEINPEVKDQMILAFNLLDEKKIQEAIDTFSRIIEDTTWHFYHKEALLGLCRCYREKDDFIKAMEFVSTAMSKDSSPMYFITIKHRDAFAIEIASIQLAFGQINSARRSLSCVKETNLFELSDTLSRNLSEAEKMLNQLVTENEGALVNWNFCPQIFEVHVEKHLESIEYNNAQIMEKVRICMSIATKFHSLRLLQLECYILQNLKKESDLLIAELKKEDLEETDVKKLSVLLILYEYQFVFEWALFPKLKRLTVSPILDLGERFTKATHELDGPLCQRWKYYQFYVFPCLIKVEEELLKENLSSNDKESVIKNMLYFDISNKGLISRLTSILGRLEIGPPKKSNDDFCMDMLSSLLNFSIRMRPSHMAYFDRGRGFKVLGQMKEAEEDFRSSIYLKKLLQFPNDEDNFY